jgi:hypothetical protein
VTVLQSATDRQMLVVPVHEVTEPERRVPESDEDRSSHDSAASEKSAVAVRQARVSTTPVGERSPMAAPREFHHPRPPSLPVLTVTIAEKSSQQP